MIKVNIAEAKAKLSDYLERSAQGERVLICRHNRPVAELRPVEMARTEPRPIGPLPGRPVFDVPPSFFEPMPDEELAEWEGDRTVTFTTTSAQRASRVAEPKSRYGARRKPRARR